jgi:hypothetical protein
MDERRLMIGDGGYKGIENFRVLGPGFEISVAKLPRGQNWRRFRPDLEQVLIAR